MSNAAGLQMGSDRKHYYGGCLRWRIGDVNGYAHSKLLGNGSDIGIQNAATNYELRQCNVIVSRKKNIQQQKFQKVLWCW